MRTISLTLQIELWAFLTGLAIVVAYGMLSGTINMKGLLDDKFGVTPASPPSSPGSGFSPARLQLMLASVAVAFYYIGQIFTTLKTGEFPTIPNEMLYVLGGSHTFYLGSKIVGLISERLRTG